VKRYGIGQGSLVAKGYGLTRPVASNDTPAGKALNRRVELERLR
jgi:outer membrane protein OmpA-like peptidoglycan-associated protein